MAGTGLRTKHRDSDKRADPVQLPINYKMETLLVKIRELSMKEADGGLIIPSKGINLAEKRITFKLIKIHQT